MRVRILKRFTRSLAATVLAWAIPVAASDDFRNFLGSSPYAPFVLALAPALLMALDKAIRER